MSRSGQIQRILSPSYSLKFIKADGDCFYRCVSTALGSQGAPTPAPSVSSLRSLVSTFITQDTFDMMRYMWEAQQAGYEHMRRCKSLEDLKAMTSRQASDGGYIVWAESHAVQVVANEERLVFLIMNEEVKGRNNPSRFIAIRPEKSRADKFLILQRTRRAHYNLISCDGALSWDETSLPSMVRKRWGLPAAEGEEEMPAKRVRTTPTTTTTTTTPTTTTTTTTTTTMTTKTQNERPAKKARTTSL